MDVLFDFEDIVITPGPIVINEEKISSLSLYKDGSLPVFFYTEKESAASSNNFRICHFNDIDINCLYTNDKNLFSSFDLKVLTNFIEDAHMENQIRNEEIRIALMYGAIWDDLLDVIKKLKIYYPNCVLLVGCVSDPISYSTLSEMGVDYVTIGTGYSEIYSIYANSGLGYPDASLIRDVYQQSLNLKNPAKIVAFPSVTKMQDYVKALALGADYILSSSIISENILKINENRFINDFQELLKNAIVYSGKTSLEEFISQSNISLVSESSRKRIYPKHKYEKNKN